MSTVPRADARRRPGSQRAPADKRKQHPSARPLGRALAVVVVLFGIALPQPVSAQSTPPAPAQTDILELVSQTPVIEPDADATIRLRVTGAPAGARIQLTVHTRVPTRSDFKAALAGKVTRGRVGSPLVLPAVPDASGIVVVTLPTHDLQTEGVYPLGIDLLSDKGSPLDSLLTFLVRMPQSSEFGPLGVAIVLPIGGPPALRSDGTTTLDSTTGQAVLSEASILEAHAALPITITASGETVDAIDTATAAELRQAAVGRQIALSTYVRLHPSEWLASGLTSELQRQYDRSTATLRDHLGAPDVTTYVADDRLTPEAARDLHQKGVRSVVVPEAALSPLDDRVFNRTLTQPFDLTGVDGVEAAVADGALSAHAGETGDPILDANHLVADLAVLYFDDPPDKRAAVVAFSDQQQVDPQMLDALLAALDPASNRILQPISLATLFSTVPRAGSRGETNGRGTQLTRTLTPAAGSNLSAFATELRAAEIDLASYRGMVTTDNPRPDEFDRRLLVAGALDLSAGERTAYVDGVRNAIAAETAKVQGPARQTINFTARDGVVSVTLHNTTGYPVKTLIRLQGDKLEFPGHENGLLEVTLSDETTRVSLNVRARASGDSPLDLTLSAPDGHLVIDHARITVRSTAFSGVGVVLLVGAGLFLAVWWLRNAVATRRERRKRLKHAAGNRA